MDLQEDSEKAQEKLKIAVIVNPGEESGSPASRAFMDEQAKKTDVALVYEPGRPGNGFVRSRKGSMFLTVNFHGRPAHAGNNPQDGRNAVEAMAIAIPEIKAIASKYKRRHVECRCSQRWHYSEHNCRRRNRSL